MAFGDFLASNPVRTLPGGRGLAVIRVGSLVVSHADKKAGDPCIGQTAQNQYQGTQCAIDDDGVCKCFDVFCDLECADGRWQATDCRAENIKTSPGKCGGAAVAATTLSG